MDQMTALPNIDLTRVLVCTVATQENEGLAFLKESCQKFNIDLKVLGMGQQFRGFGWRLKILHSYLLEHQAAYDILLTIDGYDMLFTTGLEEILEKYINYSTPLLIAAEPKCWPFEYPSPDEYPPAPTHYRYVNAGGYIGDIKYITHLMTKHKVPYLNDWDDDQRFWAWLYVLNVAELKLDHYCQVFQCMNHALEDLVIENKLRNQMTGSTPCIVHGNGRNDMRRVISITLKNRVWAIKTRCFFNEKRWVAWYRWIVNAYFTGKG
jgi:lysyl hydroxylase/galactosyltransferase/glucosyltransferase